MPATLSTLAKLVKGAKQVFDRYPVTRGMVTYAMLWPGGNLVQQALDSSRDSLDLLEALRYGLYGSLVTAPLLYKWVNVLTRLVPGTTLKHAVAKGYMDQLLFAPFNISQFFLGMSLLEGKTMPQSVCEWQDKFLPTWMVSLSIWPILQTINFSLVPEKNRVMAISLGSFFWMVFLSYVHHTRAQDLPEPLAGRRVHYDYKHGQVTREALATTQSLAAAAADQGWKSFFPVTAHCSSKSASSHFPEDVLVKRTE